MLQVLSLLPAASQGDADCVSRALSIVVAAVDRYKDLCEGRCSGMTVRQQ